jgi:hypothetical protein
MIAERILKLNDRNRSVDVAVRIFAPEREKKSWACRYEIAWPDGSRVAVASGFDAVQALFLALQMIGAEIYTSDHHKEGRLMWTQAGSGYGFPVTHNLRDLLIGDDANYL